MSTTDQTSPREIDWATAEVSDGELKVDLTGDSSKAWTTRLEAVLDRLTQPGSLWGRVGCGERQVKVSDVSEGHESEVRHFLDAAVQQTNADFAADAGSGGSGGSASGGSDGGSDADRSMTEAFRAGGDASDEDSPTGP